MLHIYLSASFSLRNVVVENCGKYGIVIANKTFKNISCINVIVRHCCLSGIMISDGAHIILSGSRTLIHGNCRSGRTRDYGIRVYDTDSNVEIIFPLTEMNVSFNNQGERNWGGYGYDGGR